jgi:hypothetical protein
VNKVVVDGAFVGGVVFGGENGGTLTGAIGAAVEGFGGRGEWDTGTKMLGVDVGDEFWAMTVGGVTDCCCEQPTPASRDTPRSNETALGTAPSFMNRRGRTPAVAG